MCFQWSSEFSQPARCDYQRSDNWSSRPASVIDSDIDARQRLGDQSWSVDCGRARDVAAAGRRPAVTSPASAQLSYRPLLLSVDNAPESVISTHRRGSALCLFTQSVCPSVCLESVPSHRGRDQERVWSPGS